MKIIRTMLASIITLGLLQSNVAAGEFNPVLDIKDPAPKWAALPATDGKRYAFDDFKEKDVIESYLAEEVRRSI